MDRYRCAMPEVKVFMGVGATIDYEADAVVRAPRWMTRNGLEWVYRITTEPKRYWRRYLRDMEFFWLVLLDGLGLYRPPAHSKGPTHDQDRHGRAGQDGAVPSGDCARPSRHRSRRRLRLPLPTSPTSSSKHAGLKCYADFDRMLDERAARRDRRRHAVEAACADGSARRLTAGLHVFCEKPFVLDVADGERAGRARASQGRCVTQVGYHYRFVGAFKEAARIVKSGALGTIHHVRAEAYGPVVLRPKGGTWRSAKNEGGGALYDYACHAIDLVNFIVGDARSTSTASFATACSRATSTTRSTARCVSPTARAASSASTGATRAFARCRPRSRSGAPTAGSPPTARSASSICASRTPRCPASTRAGRCATRPISPTRSGSTCAARSTRRRSTTSPRASRPVASTARTPSPRRWTPTASSR